MDLQKSPVLCIIMGAMKRLKKPYLHFSFRLLLALAVFTAAGFFIVRFRITRSKAVPVSAENVAVSREAEPSAPPTAAVDINNPAAAAQKAVSMQPIGNAPAENSLPKGSDSASASAQLAGRLFALGYRDTDAVPASYTAEMTDAVRLFQRSSGLPVTGTADAKTQALLLSDAAQPYCIRMGDTGTDVTALQYRLTELGYYGKRINGYYGTATAGAVRQFEQNNGFTADGCIQKEEWDRLFYDAVPAASLPAASASAQTGYSRTAEGLCSAAADALGKPYCRGGQGPDSYDSAGFLYACLQACSFPVSHSSVRAFAENTEWKKVSVLNMLKRGDIVFFSPDADAKSTQWYAGIYMGDYTCIAASATLGEVVRLSLTEEPQSRDFLFARRVIA